MKHSDFRLNLEFETGNGRWRVTDVGTRTVVAIPLTGRDPSWHSGPPYAVEEVVFSEPDFAGCEEVAPKYVTVTDYDHGPFIIVVTDPAQPNDPEYPMVIGPTNGYDTKDAALAFIQRFAARSQPYLGLHFRVTQLTEENSFVRFCSWED